ncbi:transcription factor jumonji (JmjC) domain-containing protein [Citrus sinensis]|nr:transcription factor jumonji (JmjC) domain-containing protein [Citrus sinensis]
MGKGRTSAVLGQKLSVASTSKSASLSVPSGPVYYPTEDEFKDPLEYICKIRAEAERYGICKIVPPKSWKPPFALDLGSFTFPTKTQAIHQLQARSAACDSKTFELEYSRFLKEHIGTKLNKKVFFEGEELDLCKLFNAAKRFGGYDKVVKEKKWGEVFRFVRSNGKISDCARHVLCQLYYKHLYDYEKYYNKLNKEATKGCKRGLDGDVKSEDKVERSSSKRRRRNNGDQERVKVCHKVDKEDELDQICEQCKSGLHGEVMLLCDRCNKGWHVYCLSPPLKHVPRGNWYCLECLNSDKDSFGFVPGKRYTVESFRRVADRAKKKRFRSGSASRVQMEKKFWEIVEGAAGNVEVMYGSDLDTSIYGSGFPRVCDHRPESVDANVWNEYCNSPWNLNNLPKLKGSILRMVHHNITGVEWNFNFSFSCTSGGSVWWILLLCFARGDPKCWYSVPGSEAGAFEKVMRSSLPDLFDAQPDLLFQLVTMLNPSVLVENGVPVYSVLQEPGNFVITFPRSYHAGFNFGLNCAEAVNFAPADWLPHGGFGADLYQQYHKAAVLSHEELLCVVAKSDLDSKVSPYLKRELLRVYTKERMWRERLWRKGIIKSTPMGPRKCPEYVGTEEDPTCIICRQYLYLSAVACRCRPAAFVCLEVKGVRVTMSQLVEQWLSCSLKVLQGLFSSDAYGTLLREAEQFLWAGFEMDAVRDMVNKLIEARRWAEGIRDCLHKAENWSSLPGSDSEKVHLDCVNELLGFDPLPCNEPGHLILKNYAEEARSLIQEINAALSACSKISELELLYSRASGLPIYIVESEKLSQRISSAKVWRDSVRKCISNKCPAAIEIDVLYKLESEALDLKIEVPQTDMLLKMIGQAESCRARCSEALRGSMSLKTVELLLQELGDFTVNMPELELLKQYHSDAIFWIARLNDILVNINGRKDQHNVIDELNCILKEGASLRIQVDDLPLVEVELKKAHCREKALKACDTKMPLDFIRQVTAEAVILQIEREKLFIDLSGVLAAAMRWEERAADILIRKAQMCEFEDIIRASQDIFVVLPSLDEVQNEVSTAKSWLKNSELFLASAFAVAPASCSLLRLESLKDLVSQSKFLKISLKEQTELEKVINNCERWQNHASSLLQDARCLLDKDDIGDGLSNSLVSKIEQLITSMESAANCGLSLGFDFHEISELQNACSTLHWCKKALSFLSVSPSLEDVESLMAVAEGLSTRCFSSMLWNSLIHGVKWLKRALEVIFAPCKFKRCKLSDVEEVLAGCKESVLCRTYTWFFCLQGINFSFPVVIGELTSAIQKHKLWQEQVHQFFNLKCAQQSWSLMLQLKELGEAAAFDCPELEKVLSKVDKVENWKQRCKEIVGTSVGDKNSLLGLLQKIKQSVHRSLYIYNKPHGSVSMTLCMCCESDSKELEFLICSACKDCYHLQCLRPTEVDRNHAEAYICPYCQYFESESVSQFGGSPLRFGGKRSDLRMLIELLSDSEFFCRGIEAKDVLQEVVDVALECKTCLTDIVKGGSAAQAREAAGVFDRQSNSALDFALARNLWRVRVNFNGSKYGCAMNTSMNEYEIVHGTVLVILEGLLMNISPKDHYRQKLMELNRIGSQWADVAKKVVLDSGALSLDKVFELIAEGENLPVYLEKELKSLRARSMLYCICRKPYDEKAMIACYQCDEWYHIDCVKLLSAPEIYICAACKPQAEESSTPQNVDGGRTNAEFLEPKTPSPKHTNSRKKLRKAEPGLAQKMLAIANNSSVFDCSSGIDNLCDNNVEVRLEDVRKPKDDNVVQVELDSILVECTDGHGNDNVDEGSGTNIVAVA